jgi:hypothetical protein
MIFKEGQAFLRSYNLAPTPTPSPLSPTPLSTSHYLSQYFSVAGRAYHRVHTEWQLPISGVHSFMTEKSALAGEGEGCTSIPFHYVFRLFTIMYKVAMYADTLALFHLY